jgi:3',5'-cyclic-AMP phosphodiesterase
LTAPFLLVQLSDPHIGATWTEVDPTARWLAAIESVAQMPNAPDAVLVSGDLADTAADAEYAVVKSALDGLHVPAYVLPGNHDDRARLREHFELPGPPPGDPAAPVDYATDLPALRLVVLDSTVPGRDSGAVSSEQLAWLEAELSAASDQITFLAMHHPPFITGVPAWDAIGLAPSDRDALADVVGRHPHLSRILAGHVHRGITAELGGRIVMSCPSTYIQGRLHFGATELELTDEPAGFTVHAVHGTDVISYIHPVGLDPAGADAT